MAGSRSRAHRNLVLFWLAVIVVPLVMYLVIGLVVSAVVPRVI